MVRARPGGRTWCGMVAAVVACTLAGTVGAQSVVKCIDADGNVTYQDSPCASGRSGRAVELPKAETLEDTRAWETAAKDARVVRGMPKRWVLKSRGAPLEIRPGAPRDDATEVWRYSSKEGVLLVGFTGPNVGWVREEAVPKGGAPAATPAADAKAIDAKSADAKGAAGTPVATRGAQNRRFVLEGRYCEHVFTEIGTADREAPVPTGGTRYTYEPREGDPAMRTTFSCVNGKVVDVERVMTK